VRDPHCHGLRKVLQRINGAAIRVLDETSNVIEMHEHAGDFKQSCAQTFARFVVCIHVISPMRCWRSALLYLALRRPFGE
jgi:hypothetical protein